MWAAKIDLKDAYFHLPLSKKNSTIHSHENWRKNFSIQRGLLWPRHITSTLDGGHEGFRKKMEIKRYHGVHLFGRHFNRSTKQRISLQTHQYPSDRSKECRHGYKSGKIHLGTLSKSQTFRFLGRFSNRSARGTSFQIEEHSQRIRKNTYEKSNVTQKNGSHFRGGEKFSDMFTVFKSIHRPFKSIRRTIAHKGMGYPLSVSQELKTQVRELNIIMTKWKGRPLIEKVPIRKLQSDASNTGWAGLDLIGKNCVHEFWRSEGHLHINVKELHAAMATVQSLAKPGEEVHLDVDNSVAYSYMKKMGGRKLHLNALMRPFLKWCAEKRIQLHVNQVKSAEMQADTLSRWSFDHGDYSLNPKIFKNILHIFYPKVIPEIDMFASPGNRKLTKFVSRWPHHQAWGHNALEMSLEQVTCCYANPPGR